MIGPFFTADTHFLHENVIKYCNRPFADKEEMSLEIARRWNETVPENGVVYFLGDFAFARKSLVREILNAINGKIYLIRGNHDKSLRGLYDRFEDVWDLKTILVPDLTKDHGHQTIVLCHYPLLTWDRQRYKSWMLHGHCHGSMPSDFKNRRVDVGTDCWNFTPVSYTALNELIAG